MPRSEKLKEAIELFGKEIVEIAGELIRNEPKVNTGLLMKSLESRAIETAFGTSYTLLILAEDYFVFVNDGRKPNSKPPPIAPIKEWCEQKGIDVNLAYPIAKSIGKKGIPATNISERMFKQALSNIEFRKFEDGVSDWVDDLITENLKGLSKKGNITFK